MTGLCVDEHTRMHTNTHLLTGTITIINSSLVPDLKHRMSGGTTRVTSDIHKTSWACTISVLSVFCPPPLARVSCRHTH